MTAKKELTGGRDPQLAAIGDSEEVELSFYLSQVERFLDGLYQDMTNAFHARAGGDVGSEMALVFFQSKERYDNLKLLLQYLVFFVKELSARSPVKKGLDKPFSQFKRAIQKQVDLLLECDVRIAIQREYLHDLPLKERHYENMERRIEQHYRALCALIDGGKAPTREGLLQLFEALRQFSRFWFDLKKNQYQRVRRSDFYIFKLSNLLIEKFRQGQAQLAPN